MNDDTPDLDAELAELLAADNDRRAAEEQWRAQPESVGVGDVHAFGLYFLLNIPEEEAFDGFLSVGVTGPSPDEDPADHRPVVVLGFTGDSGARLTNVLLQPDEAQQLAGQLRTAAITVERYEAIHGPTLEEQQEYMAQLAIAVLPDLTDEQLIAGGLSEDQVRELRDKMRDDSN